MTRTDVGNAELFAHEHGDRFRYIGERQQWIHWTGHQWTDDHTGEVERAAHRTVRDMLTSAAAIPDQDSRNSAIKWALQSENDQRIRAMLRRARVLTGLAVSQHAFDQHPFLLACPNGTLDLTTGRLRPPDPADLLTRGTTVPYTPDATPPHRFYRFLHEVFGGDRELIDWLRRFVGYCLTADTREHVLAVFYGTGCNGKSTLTAVLRHLLGGLATTSPFDTFVQTRNDSGPRNDLARLCGARLVTASESSQSRRLDESTVKEITGGDTIAARFLYQELFEYRPTFKIILSTNHKPRVHGDDEGIWRRLRLVPFAQSFLDRKDDTLDEQLRRELPGILHWAVRGCLEWQSQGLGTASAVTEATQEYRDDEDVIGAFLSERCRIGIGSVTVSELRADYEKWCSDVSEQPVSGRAFGSAIGDRPGIERDKGAKGVRIYTGLSLLYPTPRLVDDGAGTWVAQGANGA